ncbi:hypothetical protein MKEN_00767500 [Mycena kentingensis (nom. inval.)]|nr:hypothetical protein MKEN_00767500 [Mycena kentingensis (nom. inval.)]
MCDSSATPQLSDEVQNDVRVNFDDRKAQFHADLKAILGVDYVLNPHNEYASAISASVQDGLYQILVHPRWFGTSTCVPSRDQDHETILRAIEPVQTALNVLGGISIVAKHSIDTHYDLRRIDEIREKIGRVLGMRISLDPCWVDVYRALEIQFSRRSDHRFGRHALNFFLWFHQYFCSAIQKEGMEAVVMRFRNELTQKVVRIRIVPVFPAHGAFVIENGVGYLQTNAVNWGFWLPQFEDGAP